MIVRVGRALFRLDDEAYRYISRTEMIYRVFNLRCDESTKFWSLTVISLTRIRKKFGRAAAIVLVVNSVGAAKADSFQDTVAEATAAAVQICQAPPMNQSSESNSLSAQGNAALTGFLKKMVTLDGQVSGQTQDSASYGILQKDLAEAISNGNDCRLKAMASLLSYANSQRETSTPAAPVIDPDGIYQFGQEIGKVQNVGPITQGAISFGLIQATAAFDPNQEFTYRGIKLKIVRSARAMSISGPGVASPVQSFQQVSCEVVN